MKRSPYQYSVLILGPRQHNYTVSDYKGLDVPEIETYNNSYLNPNPTQVRSVQENNVSRWRRDGYDSYGSSGYGSHSYCPEGIPVETALFAVTGAAALAFGILFMAITMITMPGRRKRRETNDLKQNEELEPPLLLSGAFSDLIYQGSHCKFCNCYVNKRYRDIIVFVSRLRMHFNYDRFVTEKSTEYNTCEISL